jgi:lysophosphatidate acyltransferase
MSILSTFLIYVFLPYATTALTLYALSIYVFKGRLASLAEFGARAMGYILGLLICAIYGSVASLVLKCVGLGGLGQWTTAKSFKWIMYPLSGVWFDIEDDGMKRLEAVRPAVVLGNHQTQVSYSFNAEY